MIRSIISISILLLILSIIIDYEYSDLQYYQIRLFHHLFTMKHKLVLDTQRPNLSAEFRASESLLRNRLVVPIDPTLEPLDMIKKVRESFQINLVARHPVGCQPKRQLYGFEEQTIETYWIDFRDEQQNGSNSDNILLYFHGGGYALGSIKTHSGLGCHLSRYFNMTVIYLEYRLVPEHPLPAAIEDGLMLYQVLLRDGFVPSRLAILGDSAGGGLALLTVQAILSRSLPTPGAVITISPWADLTLSSESYERNRETERLIILDEISPLIPLIVGPNHTEIARNDSRYSPVYGSFKNFPPMYITVGTAEVLEDDARRVAEKAQNEGVNVTFVPGEHMIHDYPIFFSFFPEARNALEDIGQWLEKHLAF